MTWALPQKAAAGKTENGAPEAVDVHRDDRHVDAFYDAFEAAAEGEQLADARDFAFGEDADYFAVAQRVGGFAQRMDHFARALVGSDGNYFEDFCERLDKRVIVDAFEHQETEWPVGGGKQEHGVHPGGMVRSEERSAARGDIFLTCQIEAVNRVGRNPQQQTQQRVRQEPQEI